MLITCVMQSVLYLCNDTKVCAIIVSIRLLFVMSYEISAPLLDEAIAIAYDCAVLDVVELLPPQ